MKSFLIALSLPLIAVLPSCNKSGGASDLSFARETFSSLVKGEDSVKTKIDWQTLTSQGTSVGTAYNQLPTEPEKEQFKTAFVTSFSSSFRENGGSVDNFKDWRVTFSDTTRTEVAADSPGGKLKLTVSERDGTHRISSIDIVK